MAFWSPVLRRNKGCHLYLRKANGRKVSFTNWLPVADLARVGAPPPLFWVKSKIAKGRQTGRASPKIDHASPPPLAQGLEPPLGTFSSPVPKGLSEQHPQDFT